MDEMEFERDVNLFGSGTIWVITCVLVTAVPTLCSCIFRFISENENLSISIFLSNYLLIHLKDILLITFSISCSLLALSIDKSKLIKKNLKKVGIILSGASGILSSFYYFYIDGKEDFNPQNDFSGKNDFNILIFYLILIIGCSIIGFIIGNRHDKYTKENGFFKRNKNN